MIRRFLGILAACMVLCSCAAPSPGPKAGAQPALPAGTAPPKTSGARPLQELACLYYDAELVRGGIASPAAYEADGQLAAGMVPHHLLAADMIAGFFSLAGEQKDAYDSVLIISPSHFPENCKSDAVTANAGWDTPYGDLPVDSGIVRAFLQNGRIAAENNPDAVEADHGAAGLIPFVKYYLPDTKAAVLLLSNRLSRERLSAVWETVQKVCAENRVLLVASADCSHYLMPADAAKRDGETAEAIESFDYGRILGFSDANVDSPQTVTTFLKVAEPMTLTRLGHSSSPEKLPFALTNPAYDEGITTYYVYAATR